MMASSVDFFNLLVAHLLFLCLNLQLDKVLHVFDCDCKVMGTAFTKNIWSENNCNQRNRTNFQDDDLTHLLQKLNQQKCSLLMEWLKWASLTVEIRRFHRDLVRSGLGFPPDQTMTQTYVFDRCLVCLRWAIWSCLVKVTHYIKHVTHLHLQMPEPVPWEANDVLCSSCGSLVSRLQIIALSNTGQGYQVVWPLQMLKRHLKQWLYAKLNFWFHTYK